jgi:hypothetical protein
MALVAPTLDEVVQGIRRGVAAAVKEAHARGLPVFEADDTTVYAIYPDGRRIAVEHIAEAVSSRNLKPR